MLEALPRRERLLFGAFADRLHIPENRPVFVGTDGLPDPELDGFCKYLIGPGRASPRTWETYAYQISMFLRFVESQRIPSWRQVERNDLDNYFIARTTGEFQNSPRITGRSWNIAKAAIVLLYEYALENGLVKKLPFKYINRKGRFGGDVKSVPELTAKTSGRKINFIDIAQYKTRWRPLLAVGGNAQRNTALCDLLLTTGLRIHEALNLKVHQIPDPDDMVYRGLRSVTLKVVGKGNKARTVRLPKRIARQIRFYIEEDRTAVSGASDSSFLFLSRLGNRLSERRVQDFFSATSSEVGVEFSPHGCRHTFAIYQLDAMIKRLASNMKDLKREGAGAYRQIILDPMRTLQRLLGHSDIGSTYIYLDFLEEAEAMIDETLDAWTQWESVGD